MITPGSKKPPNSADENAKLKKSKENLWLSTSTFYIYG